MGDPSLGYDEPAPQNSTDSRQRLCKPRNDVFKGRASESLPAVIDGEAGAAWAMSGQVRAAFLFSIEGGRITAIDLVMEPEHLAGLTAKID